MNAAFRISVLALCLSVGSLAHAQDAGSEPTPAQVRTAAEAFDKGREAYKAEDYVEAAEQFERADNNAPSAAALELAVRSRDRAGELDRAATLLALGLKRYPDQESLVKISSDLSKRASATLFQLTANCDMPCELTVGGKLVHGAPDTQRVLYLQPGKFTLRAGWSDDRNDSKRVEAEAGGHGEVYFVAPPSPAAKSMSKEPDEPVTAPPAASQPDRDEGTKKSGGWSPMVFYVGAGLTAVLGGVTIWSGVDTLKNPGKSAVDRACDKTRPDFSQDNCTSLYNEGHSHQTRTNALIGVTAGVGVATALVGILATDWGGNKPSATEAEKSAHRARSRVSVVPWASLDGGGLFASGRF